jgi:hypothetical protein
LAAGVKTAEQVEAQDAEYKSRQTSFQFSNVNGAAKGAVKPSKFNNFAGSSGVDYTAAAQLKINRG